MIVRYTDEEFEKSKGTDLLALECEHCGKVFKAEKKAIKHELQHGRKRLKYCSRECLAETNKKRHKVFCEQCGKELEIVDAVFKVSKTKHFFCNHSCAARYNNSKRGSLPRKTKIKIRKGLNEHFKKSGTKRRCAIHKCKICGKEYHPSNKGATRIFCSRECLSEYRKNRKKYLSEETIKKLSNAGKHSVVIQSENRRSKNEKLFYELCEKHFDDVKHNEPQFNGWDADVIIEDIKVAVLWNGKWHYEKIKENHSVAQVQNRDKIKIREIESCGYKPYIVKDMGKYNAKFVHNEFKKFLETF